MSCSGLRSDPGDLSRKSPRCSQEFSRRQERKHDLVEMSQREDLFTQTIMAGSPKPLHRWFSLLHLITGYVGTLCDGPLQTASQVIVNTVPYRSHFAFAGRVRNRSPVMSYFWYFSLRSHYQLCLFFGRSSQSIVSTAYLAGCI